MLFRSRSGRRRSARGCACSSAGRSSSSPPASWGPSTSGWAPGGSPGSRAAWPSRGVTLALALLAGRGVVPLATRDGGALVAVEVLRWAAFGVALGELLPLDARLHQTPGAAEATA